MKRKDIIFCQGDKKELEEITGKEYEYLPPKEVIRWKEGSIFQTFLQTPELKSESKRGMDARNIEEQMYDSAKKAGADAIIHYSVETYMLRPGIIMGYGLGTPVKIKK